MNAPVALITGASRGLGFAAAEALGRTGFRVAVCARGKQSLARAGERLMAAGVTHLCLTADLVDPKAPERVVGDVLSAWNRFDVLVNNGGGLLVTGGLTSLADDDWSRTYELNVMSAVRFTRAALPALRESPRARIINVSSVVASQPGSWNPHYAAAKGALNTLSKHLSLVLAHDGILVTTVSPGIFDTSSWQAYIDEKAAEDGASAEATRTAEEARAVAQIPLGRLGQAGEVAGLIAFLASEQATYLTGSNLIVDGGKSRAV